MYLLSTSGDGSAAWGDRENPICSQENARSVLNSAGRRGDDLDLPPFRELLFARELQEDGLARHVGHRESDRLGYFDFLPLALLLEDKLLDHVVAWGPMVSGFIAVLKSIV